MTFIVEVPEDAEETIDYWQLPDSLKKAFYEKLVGDLENLPPESLVHVKYPVRFATHKFVLRDDNTETEHLFFLWINDHEKPGVRIIFDAKCLY